ncbi:MAG: FG-GAP-like repeat-containing protein [Bacteroidota bacterium]
MGLPDNNQDGLPDDSGSLNTSLINTNRIMVGDTFQTPFYGIVRTSVTYSSFSYGYATSSLQYGDTLELIGASVSVYDVSSGQTLVCDQVSYSTSISNGLMNATFDFSIATLTVNGCSSFSNYQYEDGDEVTLTPKYRVRGNIGGKVEQINITNAYYLSDRANPSSGFRFQCDTWSGNVTILGYYFMTDKKNNYSANACTRKVEQSYYLSIGDCCTNYAGGNLFPYEYRHWANIKEVEITIPTGYTYLYAEMEQYRTKATNSSVKESQDTIVASSQNGATYTFDLSQYLVENGGNINRSDDGFYGTVAVYIEPLCTIATGVNEAFNWSYKFDEASILSGQTTSAYTGFDNVKYNRANPTVSTTLQTQDGIANTVSWDIKVKNSSTKVHATNSFMAFTSTNGTINVLSVEDLTNGGTISPLNGIYQLGQINKNNTFSYRITADYNQCALDELVVHTGYDCKGYPNDLASATCGYNDFPLYINPFPGEMQVRIKGLTRIDPCSPEVDVQIEIASTKLASIGDIEVQVTIPTSQSLLLMTDSTRAEYPLDNGFASINNPTLNNYTYTITGTEMDSILGADGLVGITNTSANIVRLQFTAEMQSNFESGEILDIKVKASQICGDTLPTISLNYDPNAVFGRSSGIGIDDVEDSWGVSWTDYDLDGDPDIFVTNYDGTKANQLYQNQGNGLFTAVTSGNIVTDLAVSLGSTWGDYDNDGDPDVYVTNNIVYNNFLYRNNGDGTFIKILNDPVVNYNGYSFGASWGDYDNDGFLDLFVAELFSTRFNKLFHNNGDGTFTEVTDGPIVYETAPSVSGVWGDYDGDGDIDLFVANHEGVNNSLYRNDGGGEFTAITNSIVSTDGGKSVGASWGDIDNDGDLDLFVANAGAENNFLYQNNGDGTFTKITSGVVVTDGGNSHGSAFGDLDNDGDLDLYVSNDADENNFLYSNDGSGSFNKIDNQISSDGGESFGGAWGDYDNDGDIDLFVVNHDDEVNFFYTNERGQCSSSACLSLVGTTSNKSAIGAKIKLLAKIENVSTWQYREVSGQTGGGISGQSELRQHFGLGDATQIDSIVIEWPSGYTQSLGSQPLGSCMTITEDDGASICGKVYYDADGDCTWDSTEVLLSNVEIIISPINKKVYTNERGDFSISLPPGTYTLDSNDPNNWQQSCQLSGHSITVNNASEEFCNLNFGHEPRGACAAQPDLAINMASTAARIGFEGLNAIHYQNQGTATATDVVVGVTYDSRLTMMESTITWDSTSGNSYFWFIDSLTIGQELTIYNKYEVASNATIGDTIAIDALINASETDCDATDNSHPLRVPLEGPFDPNDILVSPEGNINLEEELTYRIRFQNVGTIAARNVRIENELPEDLDVESLVLGLASHPYRFQIEENRKLIWYFDFINLPDSTSDQLGSQGFVTYKIKCQDYLPEGTEFGNDALIYFDELEPIQTNTVYNTIRESIEAPKELGHLLIYPNPSQEEQRVTIQISPDEEGLHQIDQMEVYNNQGQLVQSKRGLNATSYEFSSDQLGKGVFWIRILGSNGKSYRGSLILL